MKINWLRKLSISLVTFSVGVICTHVSCSHAATENASSPVPIFFNTDINTELTIPSVVPETQAMINFMEDQLHIKFTLQRQPWKRALKSAYAGEGLIMGISKTKERLDNLNFSEPFSEDNAWLITRCDKRFQFNNLSDLQGKTIGMVRGTSAGTNFDLQENRLFILENDPDSTTARLIKLSKMRMDAIVFLKNSATPMDKMDKELNENFSQNNLIKKTDRSFFCILPKPVDTVCIPIAMSKNLDQSLLNQINQAIFLARKKGILKKN
ncbi:substrate-binding periplasmic protein [Undibacterium sp. Dicai25W]|uniref:substrate-binding periplasmic protein n=1 Tax=Undibacterium sp. Dicai25W TaxID=3413034 RepID=UPI003BF1788E